MEKIKLGNKEYSLEYDQKNYPIVVNGETRLFMEKDLISVIPLTKLVMQETGLELIEVLRLVQSSGFPGPYPCFKSDCGFDLLCVEKDVREFLRKWKSRQGKK